MFRTPVGVSDHAENLCTRSGQLIDLTDIRPWRSWSSTWLWHHALGLDAQKTLSQLPRNGVLRDFRIRGAKQRVDLMSNIVDRLGLARRSAVHFPILWSSHSYSFHVDAFGGHRDFLTVLKIQTDVVCANPSFAPPKVGLSSVPVDSDCGSFLRWASTAFEDVVQIHLSHLSFFPYACWQIGTEPVECVHGFSVLLY